MLLCAEGRDNLDVAEELRVTRQTVGNWRRRFVERRLDGLYDEPRPGAPRRVGDGDVERVITKTLESTPRGATHWSTRSMAKASGLSQTTISRIWRAFARRFLETVDRAVPAALEVHLILDNYATHKTPAIHRWLLKHPRFHCTPTGASWLNLVERWFATLTERCIRRGAHRSTRELEAAIQEYLAVNNEDPKPFRWTKTADAILGKVANFCRRISGSGH